MITKKDFEVFANGIGMLEDGGERLRLCDFLISHFEDVNPRFDSKRFVDWVEIVAANGKYRY